ncbi:hypothetical protein GCM10010428_47550 [Actinosynnema pretiosum subsp. pretiosum]
MTTCEELRALLADGGLPHPERMRRVLALAAIKDPASLDCLREVLYRQPEWDEFDQHPARWRALCLTAVRRPPTTRAAPNQPQPHLPLLPLQKARFDRLPHARRPAAARPKAGPGRPLSPGGPVQRR